MRRRIGGDQVKVFIWKGCYNETPNRKFRIPYHSGFDASSLIPFYAAALDDEFEGMETLDEVPFTFELEQGDLPFEELAEATLSAEDVPACIDPLLAEARGHVNRLYQQEPDDYTVMFQNRDGSKTVYVFSYPVKNSGTSVSTTATIQVNNGRIIFSGSNAITSLIGELHDYNIGYCEIQTLNSGILTADGVNITADAREWARGESFASNLVYNMSSEAAAEYNMSISENATVTAAATPGITITPIDPTPESGITVMAISYSTLAGLMSFKNVSTNQFLTLTASSSPSLTINSSIIDPYSRWYVQYDSYYGYMVSNYSNVYNTYLGFDDTDEFIIDSTSSMLYAMTVNIVSTANSIVTISCDQLAISSTGALYEKSVDDDSFPESCQWEISSKYNITLVSRIDLNSNTRVEQSGVDFYLDYGVTPSTANSYDISLYNATTHQEITHDTEAEEDEYAYYIDTPGVYSVYYKDSITGVKSANFTIVVYDIPDFTIENSLAEPIFSIQPVTNASSCLSMSVSSGVTSLGVSEYNATNQVHNSYWNVYENWENLSRAFTISSTSTSAPKYRISSILTESQYDVPDQNEIGYNSYSGDEYSLSNINNKTNTLNISSTQISLTTSSIVGTELMILDVGDHYLIFSTTLDSSNVLNNKALKYVESSNTIVATDYVSSDLGFRWTIEQIGINAPLIRQTQQYICGSATFLQVLYGAGIGTQVPESTTTANSNKGLHSQMYYLAWSAESGEEESILPYSEWYDSSVGHIVGGTDQETFAKRINEYSLFDSNAIGQYGRYIIRDEDDVLQTGVSASDVRSKIMYSLSNGWAPFVLTRTGGRPYKYSEGAAHYVCIIGFEEFMNSEGTLESYVIVSNCHWVGTVLGIYAIPLEEFYNKVSELFYYYLPTN